MTRRAPAIVLAVLLGLVLLAAPAGAGESIDDGQFAGSRLDPQPGPNATGEVSVTGRIRSSIAVWISLRVSITPSEGGCEVPAPAPTDRGPNPHPIAVTFTTTCNGVYVVQATGTTNWNATATLDQAVVVSMPAPTVTGVSAAAEGRRVTVTWDDMRPEAPDLSGYVVERSIGGGEFSEVATTGADVQSATDSSLPPEGGEATYRVLATRPAPDGPKVSAAGVPAVTRYDAAPIDPATGQPVPDAPADGGAGGGGGGGTGSGTGSGGGGARGGAVTRPRVGLSGTFFPPLLRPTPKVGITTTTTVDDGFGETLPYDEREQGPTEAEVPDDEMAAILTGEHADKGMVIPVATALVLAVWALHLRMLARAARPTE